MVEELVTRIKSFRFEEADGGFYIDSFTWDGPSHLTLGLTLRCGNEPPELWYVSCDLVLAHHFRRRSFSSSKLELSFDHPVLWPHTRSQKELYFSSTPSNPAAVFGSLVEALLDLVGPWFPISWFLNRHIPTIKLLSGRHGLLAAGPEPIVDRLASVLARYDVRHSVLPCPHGRHIFNSSSPVRGLIFDDAYVAAHNIEARRKGPAVPTI